MAARWAKARYTGFDSAEITGIQLARYGCNDEPKYWYWLVSFLPMKNGRPHPDAPIAILLNGTVIAATKTDNQLPSGLGFPARTQK